MTYQTNRLDASRLTVVVGHFGSGKTEFAVNMALLLSEHHPRVALADLDVVDPYFRSRECADLFNRRNIRLISSSQSCADADIPSMPPDVMALMDDPGIYGVLDIGGDASGARVLARYRHRLKACGARVLCVINANRPLTNTAEKSIQYIRSIEASSGMAVDGLVNNTHLCDKTELEDVLNGAAVTSEIANKTGIPIICHSVHNALAPLAAKYVQPIFTLELFMKKPWE